MKPRGIVSLALLLMAAFATPAAAFEWQPVQTLNLVRGFPEPRAAIDGSGKSTVVYAGGEYDQSGSDLAVRLFARAPGGRSSFFESSLGAGRAHPAVAVNPSGAAAIASVRAGELYLTLVPAPGPRATPPAGDPRPVTVTLEAAGYELWTPRVAIDGAGAATVVWVSPAGAGAWTPALRPVRVYAASISPAGAVTAVRQLGEPGRECAPELDVNLRGDAVVATNCRDTRGEVFYRPAGGDFGPAETIPGFFSFHGQVTIDGAGTAVAIDAADHSGSPRGYDYQAYEFVRPAGGSFGGARRLPIPASAAQLELQAQEDGRGIALWREGGRLVHAIRAADGALGPGRQIAGANGAYVFGLVSAPSGPALVWWIETTSPDEPESPAARDRVMAAMLGTDGTAETGVTLGVPGPRGASRAPSFAVNAQGRAVGAWEQRCAGGGFAVMVVVRDDPRSDRLDPPCQDAKAPKVAVRPQRARLVGRRLRVRVGCDEACTLGVRVRVLRAGRGRPLATGRLRDARIGAGRYRTVAVRLRARQAATVARALSRGSRVTTRLAIPVRDAYGNGAVRRIAVPLR